MSKYRKCDGCGVRILNYYGRFHCDSCIEEERKKRLAAQVRASNKRRYWQRREEDPDGFREDRRIWNRKYLYGIDQHEYEELFNAQRGLCAICGKSAPLHVDHDHQSGWVRGLLCVGCNTAVGIIEKRRVWYNDASRYLNDYRFRRDNMLAPMTDDDYK